MDALELFLLEHARSHSTEVQRDDAGSLDACLRGQGSERQATKRDVVLVTDNGGILDHHSTLVLSPHAA
jgi:hypothetical protein